MEPNSRSNELMHAAATNNDTLRELADHAERRASIRRGMKPVAARAALAREWRVSFWTLTHFRKRRLKDLRGTIRDRIQAGIVRELEHEMIRLAHDLYVAHQGATRLSGNEILEITAALARAGELLEERKT